MSETAKEKDLRKNDLQYLEAVERILPGIGQRVGYVVEVEEFEVEGERFAGYLVADNALSLYWVNAFLTGCHSVETALLEAEISTIEGNQKLRAA